MTSDKSLQYLSTECQRCSSYHRDVCLSVW